MTDNQRLTHAILEAQSAGAAKPWLDQLIAALCYTVDLKLHPTSYRYDLAPAPGASLHCDYRQGSNPDWDFAVMAPAGDRP